MKGLNKSLTLATALFCGTAACGDDGHHAPNTAPDASVDAEAGADITITVYAADPIVGYIAANATLVAIQDEAGDWKPLTGTEGVYKAKVTGYKYGVAVGCDNGPSSASRLSVSYQTVDDDRAVTASGCDLPPSQPPPRAHVHVKLSGLAADANAEVAVGLEAVSGSNDFTLDVSKGKHPVFARTIASDLGSSLLVWRGPTLDIQSDLELAYDFGALAKPVEQLPLTVQGAVSGDRVAVSSLLRVPGTFARISTRTEQDPKLYDVVPASLRAPGDTTELKLTESHDEANRQRQRIVSATFLAPGARTATLPAIWDASTPKVVDAAKAVVHFSFPVVAKTLSSVRYTGSVSTAMRELDVEVSPSWLGTVQTAIFETPDLSRVAGWTPRLGLESDKDVFWSLSRDEDNGIRLSSDGHASFSVGYSGRTPAAP